MLPPLSVSTQPQTATNRSVLCCGCAGLSFVAMVWFGLLQRTQASENSHPDHQVSATTAKTRPQLVASYYKLPLSFEANKGQTDARVHFLARGGGYTIFLAGDEAVLTLRKSSPSVSRLGKFGPPGRLEPFGLDDPHPVRWPSIGGYLKSLWRSLIPDLSQMVPDPNAGKRGVAGGPEAQPPQVVRMRLLGGNAKGRVVGLDELPGRSNYICGNDPKKWRTSVPSYAQVKFEGVYSGVDLVYYGSQRQLEYDFVVAPGANPDQIKLSFTGADGMRVDAASGDLVLKVGDDEVRFQKPAVYQSAVAPVFGTAGWEPDADLKVRSTLGEPNPEPRIPNPDALSGAFVLASNNEVAFRVAGYDPRRALVIDPVLSYSTYLGGSGGDQGDGIAVDTAGNAYVTGYTMSTDFPTANPLQGTCGSCNGFYTAFVAKLNPTGSALVYSTYLGGSGGDQGDGIAVDTAGNAYVTGWTASTDFPTANPLQTKCDNCQAGSSGDAFVAKISPGPAEVTLSTNTLTFASYSAGTTSAEESVTLTSSGAGLLTLTSITASGDFALITTGTSCPYTGGSVASSATCTIDVTFTPTTTGLRTGSVTINDNASNTPQVVSLSGTGTAPGVSLSTTSVSFGNQAVGTTSASRAVTVTNNGTASLTFTGIAATGDFTVAASGTTCSSSAPVAASSNCVINVLFTPTATGSRSGSLTLTDNASGTPQTVSLSGTGTGPVVSLSARLTFSAQLVGTTSSSQAVTLTNTGNASLTFTAIAVTAPFAIATSGTTCSTSSPVAAAATCTVAVTFMPTVAGSASGTLSFSDDAPNTPQTIALTGTGQDFSFAPPSGSSTSATVAPGSPATYTLSVGGEAGLSGTVNFTCTGAPSGAICSVSPNPLTVGSSATNVTVTVTTTAPSVSAPRSRPLPPAPPLSPGLRSLLMVALVLTAMAWAIGRRNQPGVGRWRSTRVPLAVGLLLTLALAGCGGGGGGGSGPSNPGTTPGGYILTVTGSTGSGSSTLSHSVTLTLTVS